MPSEPKEVLVSGCVDRRRPVTFMQLRRLKSLPVEEGGFGYPAGSQLRTILNAHLRRCPACKQVYEEFDLKTLDPERVRNRHAKPRVYRSG